LAAVPYKACDFALRAAASLLQTNRARFTTPSEQAGLEQLTRSLGIENGVTFCGSLSHDEVLRRLGAADVLVFPSVHEFGGGVVFEALAMGAVPVVVDFGGPGDIVNPEVGFKVPLTNEDDVVLQIEKVLAKLAHDPILLEQLRQQGMHYAREYLSWDGKAQLMTQILTWVVGQGPKPDLQPRKTPPPRRTDDRMADLLVANLLF
jgi:glycosyltransferase involved in cell wall biosynthesis